MGAIKVLLLGGTGAMGKHLVTILANKENDVVITSRSYHKSKDNVRYLEGNAKELSFLESVLTEKWDAIIDFMVYKEEDFKSRNDLLLQATSHYIFLSSARVYNQSNVALTEVSERLLDTSSDKEFLSTNEYSLSKAKQENVLKCSDKKNWTIIRPYITYDTNRLQLGTLEKENWLYRALNGRTIVFSKDIMNKETTMTHGVDVAKGIFSILNKSESYGRTYHITNENYYKWNVIINKYLDVLEDKLGYRPNVVYQDFSEFFIWNPNKYQVIYDRLFDRKFDNSEINKFLDTSEFMDIETGLSSCLSNFLENPKFLNINWKNEAIKDKICNEKTPLKEIKGNKQKVKYLLYRYLI